MLPALLGNLRRFFVLLPTPRERRRYCAASKEASSSEPSRTRTLLRRCFFCRSSAFIREYASDDGARLTLRGICGGRKSRFLNVAWKSRVAAGVSRILPQCQYVGPSSHCWSVLHAMQRKSIEGSRQPQAFICYKTGRPAMDGECASTHFCIPHSPHRIAGMPGHLSRRFFQCSPRHHRITLNKRIRCSSEKQHKHSGETILLTQRRQSLLRRAYDTPLNTISETGL